MRDILPKLFSLFAKHIHIRFNQQFTLLLCFWSLEYRIKLNANEISIREKLLSGIAPKQSEGKNILFNSNIYTLDANTIYKSSFNTRIWVASARRGIEINHTGDVNEKH